jgi:chaperonin GroES
MRPILQNVLVRPYPSDEKSEGGIFVPESAREVSNKVFIVEVGNGSKEKPMKLKSGQTGFRVKDWGQEFIINGEKHYLMDQSAIIALQ